MHNFETSYKLILDELVKITNKDEYYFKPVKPKLSDIELISLIILAEFKSIDSEHQLFRELKNTMLEDKIEKRVYNKRERKTLSFFRTSQIEND